jgi:hypothetical protein
VCLWSEEWHSFEEWAHRLEKILLKQFAVTTRGGPFDEWDLEIRGGLLGGMHTKLAVEEHGGGRQLLHLRVWPIFSLTGLGIAGVFAVLTVIACLQHGWGAAVLLGASTWVPMAWSLVGCAHAKAAFESAVMGLGAQVVHKTPSANSMESTAPDTMSYETGDLR